CEAQRAEAIQSFFVAPGLLRLARNDEHLDWCRIAQSAQGLWVPAFAGTTVCHMSSTLPTYLTTALDRLTEGVSRNELTQRASATSQAYRNGGSSAVIGSSSDALAYALARMPATYAAVAGCLDAVQTARPDFAPKTMIDFGAGPGTATFAVADAFPS